MTQPAIYANFRHFYQQIFWTSPAAITRRGEGYVMTYSGKPWLSGANQLWLDDPKALTAMLIAEAVAFFRPYKCEWSLFVVPEHDPTVMTTATQLGGFVRWRSPILLLESQPTIAEDVPYPTIEVATGFHMRHMAANIMGEAFHIQADVNKNMVRPEHDETPNLTHYLAFWEGHPAATATLNLTSDMAGIWNVGTRRKFRGNGIAKALMRRLINDAAHANISQTVLMASAQGRPMYLHMGYEVVGEGVYVGFSSY